MRLRTSRKVCLGAAAALSAIIGTAALAWACTAEPMISVSALTSPQGVSQAVRDGRAIVVSPHMQTTVQVANYADNTPGRVEIRWDSLEGPVLGQADGLFVPVRIPEAPAGVHYLTAIFRGTDGRVLSKASTPVTVSGGAGMLTGSVWSSSTAGGRTHFEASTALGAMLLSIGLIAALGGAVVVSFRRRTAVSSSR